MNNVAPQNVFLIETGGKDRLPDPSAVFRLADYVVVVKAGVVPLVGAHGRS